jgi:hypothetical protein
MKIPLFALLVALPLSVVSVPAAADRLAQFGDELIRLTAGSYTSVEQAKASPTEYSVVESEIVRIWPQAKGKLWFYQENAILETDGKAGPGKGKPYFQRVFSIEAMADGRFRREVYELKEPAKSVGAWATAAPLGDLSPEALGPQGCHTVMTRVASEVWLSQTEDCKNDWRGAVGMIGIGIRTADLSANWDRGVDKDGNQVWGPTGGGYIFKRK